MFYGEVGEDFVEFGLGHSVNYGVTEVFGLNRFMTWQDAMEWFNRPFFEMAGADLSVAVIVKAVLMIAAVIIISRLLRGIVLKALSRAAHMDTGTRNAIATVVYYIVLGLGLAMALNSLVDASSIAVFTGALGLGIGLGFQDVAKNFISGIIMLLSKTIKPGDVITVGDLTGRVEIVGMYSSTMRTVYDSIVIIPNSEILSEKFINWTHDHEMRMVDISVGVHYDSDLDLVMDLMRQAAAKIEQLESTPEPRILLMSYGNSSVDFSARVWTKEVMYYQRIISAYYLELWKLFKEHNIVIPYPQQDVYIHKVPDELTKMGRS